MKQLAWILLLVLGSTASVASACDSRSSHEEAGIAGAGSTDYSFQNEKAEDDGCCDPTGRQSCARPCCHAVSPTGAFVLAPETETRLRDSLPHPALASHHTAPPKRPPIA